MAGHSGSFKNSPLKPSFLRGDDMTATYAPLEYTLLYLDEMLPDGATGEQFEAWLDLILGAIEVEANWIDSRFQGIVQDAVPCDLGLTPGWRIDEMKKQEYLALAMTMPLDWLIKSTHNPGPNMRPIHVALCRIAIRRRSRKAWRTITTA
jgi:hypothetical protein